MRLFWGPHGALENAVLESRQRYLESAVGKFMIRLVTRLAHLPDREQPVYSKTQFKLPFAGVRCLAMSDPKLHRAPFQWAIDFVLPLGTKILAAANGVVEDLFLNSRFGGSEARYHSEKWLNYIILRHDHGEFSIYGHLQARCNTLRVGDVVYQGQQIGQTGISGLMTLPHLHFHVYYLAANGSPTSICPRMSVSIHIHRSRYSRDLEPLYEAVQAQLEAPCEKSIRSDKAPAVHLNVK